MIGLKSDLEMVFFSSYDFLCALLSAFMYASKCLFSVFTSNLKRPRMYRWSPLFRDHSLDAVYNFGHNYACFLSLSL